MKGINQFIQEKLKLDKNIQDQYNYYPKTRKELYKLIHHKLIKERGEDADLNDINTSEITDMRSLFLNSRFTGNISGWDVSNVTDMESMFRNSLFDGDLSKWDVSKVKTMDMMFDGSKFTGKNGDISNWDVSNVEDMGYMFENSEFNGDISKWNVNKLGYSVRMFWGCPLYKNPPKWHKK